MAQGVQVWPLSFEYATSDAALPLFPTRTTKLGLFAAKSIPFVLF